MKKQPMSFKSLMMTVAFLMLVGWTFAQAPIQYWRPYDQRGINVFEIQKDKDSVQYDGLKVRFGAGFTQGYQSLSHENGAKAVLNINTGTGASYVETAPGSGSFINRATGVAATGIVPNPAVFGGYLVGTPAVQYTNANALYEMGGGFPLAQANLNIDVQLADGVSLNLISYMSSHHHNEFWVKGGFLKIDKVSFLKSEFLDNVWKNLTLKVGHMEVNYGDAHYRRSDGGHTLQNPWIENNIMDAFTTEIGAELYWMKNGIILMGAYTDGEIQGNILDPSLPNVSKRKPSFYGKIGYDKQLKENLRVRLTASAYTTKSSISNTLMGGDRTGSNYQFVMDNTSATVTTAYTSGRFNPGYRDNITSFMINPFVKFGGLEFFGTWEYAKGRNALENGEGSTFGELDNRQTHQTSAELLYRFGNRENLYVGARYQTLTSNLAFGQSASSPGTLFPIAIDRTSVAAGWFITRNVLLKGEYVTQSYDGYPDTERFYQGKFNGFVIQGAISF
jgi:hypothetical protein